MQFSSRGERAGRAGVSQFDTVSVPMTLVRAHLAGMVGRGHEPAELLARFDASPDEERLSLSQFARLINGCWQLVESESAGFTARPVKLGSFAMMNHAALNCPNLRRALLRSIRFFRLISDELRIELRERGDLAALEFSHANLLGLDDRAFIESLVTIWLRWSSWLIGRQILPERAEFAFAPPSYADEYPEIFACDVYFEAAANRLIFPSRYLDLAPVRNEAQLDEYLARAPSTLMIHYKGERSLSAQVKNILVSAAYTEGMTAEDVAAELDMPAATLRRSLRAEGNGFQELKDGVRREAAVRLLLDTDLSINDIADRTGFSEASAFHRAFRRWTGLAPGQFRERQGR